MKLDDLLKGIGAIAPFLAPYPSWVKLFFAAFVGTGAVFMIGLVVAAPVKEVLQNSDNKSAWLFIKKIDGRSLDHWNVRVTATVNGVKYFYPDLVGVKWLEAGPDMAGQTYEIPARDQYLVRFDVDVKNGPELLSVEEQRIESETHGIRQYDVRQLENGIRGEGVSASIYYRIDRNRL